MSSRDELLALSASVPFWWHSIDFGQGVVTPGKQTSEFLSQRVRELQLPDLRGKSVLDIGAFDGFYSFEAERRGAARVVALDHYVWSLDLPEHVKYLNECRENGAIPRPYHETPHWRPDALPGKRGFDTAHKTLSSHVESVVGDFMTIDPLRLGTFDVVFFFGVLYHLEDALGAMRRVAAFAKDLAVIETQAIMVPGTEHVGLFEFYESNELNHDVSNWWAPNLHGLAGLCRAAGFAHVEVLTPPPQQSVRSAAKDAAKLLLAAVTGQPDKYRLYPTRYRAICHARR